MNNKIRVAAIALMPAAIYCASVAPPTSKEVCAAIRSGEFGIERYERWIDRYSAPRDFIDRVFHLC